MKSLMRWGATVGIVGTAIASSWFSTTLEALALPKEQIEQKLKEVPVFAIADSKGAPLVASEKDGTRVAGVFISQTDAKKFVEDLKTKNPRLANQVKVVGVSLAEVYKLSQENVNKKDRLNFAFVPVQSQVELAKKVTTNNGQTQKYAGGVPLFVARGGKDNGYLTVEQNKDKVIPFFFEKSDLQKLVNRFKKEQPRLASTVKIEVIPLEGMINTLEKSDNQLLNKVVLIPNKESIQFLQQQAKQKPTR